MLKLTTLGLYMIVSGIVGTPANVQTATLPDTQPQVIEKTKTEIEQPVTTESYVRNYFSDLPIMIEVARCESTFRQTDSKGNILRGKKNNKDVGVMQINEFYHKEKATSLGYDLYTIEGNTQYARYLYDKEGARPWIASSPCWSESRKLAEKSGPIYE